MVVHAWSNFTTRWWHLVQLKCKIETNMTWPNTLFHVVELLNWPQVRGPTWLDQNPKTIHLVEKYTGSNLYFFCIYYPDWSSSSGWTLIGHMAIGGNGMQSLLNGCSFFLIDFDRFINPTLQPLKSPLLIGFWHFLKSLLSGFCKKWPLDIIWLTYVFYLSTRCWSRV